MLAPGAVSQLGSPDGSQTSAVQVTAEGLVGVRTDSPNAGLHVASPKPTIFEYDLENSKNPVVRQAVIRAQNLAKAGDEAGSLAAMREAAELAKGKERHVLLLEVAQRLQAKQDFDEACYDHRHGHQTEVTRRKQSCQDNRADKTKQSNRPSHADHPDGAEHDGSLQRRWFFDCGGAP